MQLPWSQACENNQAPILKVLRESFSEATQVLEIGAGTGQHAVHFARHMPWLRWQPTDRPENLPGIEAWRTEAGSSNLLPAIALDVSMQDWPVDAIDAAFSANTTHIMSWPLVERMFTGLGRLLPEGSPFCLYGPFNIDGQFTSPSNARFDAMLRQRDPRQGLRDLAALEELAANQGMHLEANHSLPANNRLLVWRASPQ